MTHRFAFFAAAFATALSAQILEPRIVSETRPAGSLVQLKVELTSPQPISTTGDFMQLDSLYFDGVEGVAVFSPAGDAYGAAVVRNGSFAGRFVSPLNSLGTQLDYPFLTVATRIRAGLATGTRIPLRLDGSLFQAADGSTYSPVFREGTLTIGGAISVFNVIPGGGMLPAGTVVRILGTGFTPQTRLDVNELSLNNVQYVNPTELQFTMPQAANMTGRRIRVRGQGNDEVVYFSYLRTAPVGASASALLNATHPVFPAQSYRTAGVTVRSGVTALALENQGLNGTDVQIELVSAAGASLGRASVTMGAATRYARTVQELFGSAAAVGTVMRVTSSADLMVMGLLLDDVNGVVNAFPPGVAPPPATPQLSASPAAVSFTATSGGGNPAAQNVAVTATNGGTLSFTASADAAWLSVSPNGGTTPGAITISAATANLAPGQYNGAVRLTPPAPGTPVTISVSLTVAPAGPTPPPAPRLVVEPASLAFDAVPGGDAPAERRVNVVTTVGVTLTYTAVPNVAWISVRPAAGSTPNSLSVGVNPAGLPPGDYRGLVTVTPPAPAEPATIVVTLAVRTPTPPGPPRLLLSAETFAFTHPQDAASVAQQATLRLESTGSPISFSLSSSAPWLSATPAQGVTPQTVTLSIQPGGLAPGTHDAILTVDPVNGPQARIPVRLTVSAPGASAVGQIDLIVNAASQTTGPVTAGQLVTLYGRGLGLAAGQSGRVSQGRLETEAGGTRVWFGTWPAPVLYASATQVNAVVPFEVDGLNAVEVAVEFEGRRTGGRAAAVAAAVPAIFTADGSGNGAAAALNQDGSVNGPSNPGRRGSVVVLYITGVANVGEVTGGVAAAEPQRIRRPVSVLVGNRRLDPLYAGTAPGLLNSLTQVNVLLSDDVPAGNAVPVRVQAGDAPSPAGVTISVE